LGDLNNFFLDIMKKNNQKLGLFKQDMSQYLTYDSLIDKKKPEYVIHLSADVGEILKAKGGNKLSAGQLEEKILMQYVNDFDFYELVFQFIQDLAFNPGVANPLPRLAMKMESLSLKYAAMDFTVDDVI
jgi:hypothetical protein